MRVRETKLTSQGVGQNKKAAYDTSVQVRTLGSGIATGINCYLEFFHTNSVAGLFANNHK